MLLHLAEHQHSRLRGLLAKSNGARIMRDVRRRVSTIPLPPAPPPPAPPRDLAGIAVFGGLTLLTLGLGAWQAQRFAWKTELVAARDEALAGEPLDVTAGEGAARLRAFAAAEAAAAAAAEGGAAGAGGARAADAAALGELRRVRVRGRFERGAAVALVGPRAPPKDLPAGLVSEANGGELVVQALRRPDGSRLLVLRGWAPSPLATAAAASAAAAAAPGADADAADVDFDIIGVLRSGERPSVFVARHAEAAPAGASAGASVGASASASAAAPPPPPPLRFHYLDVPAIARALGLSAARGDAAVLVEALRDEAAPAAFPAPRGAAQLREVSVPPATHALYSAIWFSLALAGAALTRARFRGGGRRGTRR